MPKLTAERLREVLAYDPATGEFTWLVANSNRVHVGRRAGSISRGTGYRTIYIDGANYAEARLAFLWMTGHWPVKIAEHENLDKADNRWSNLREATQSQNGANTHGRKKHLLPKGVSFDQKRNNFAAYIMVNRRSIGLGRFATPEAAHARYCEAAAEHFGEFAHF